MFKASCTVVAAIAGGACAQLASAQLTLGLDINGFDYSFMDASGASAFQGAAHTGTMRWSYSGSSPRVVEARMGEDGPMGLLSEVSLGYGLTSLDGTIQLDSGRIRGGDLTITLSNGDTYAADFAGGRLVSLGSGGFMLDARTMGGVFSDDHFGDIELGALAGGTTGGSGPDTGGLPGWALAFRFNPTAAQPSGSADVDVFVMVPLPPAALAGLGTLASIIGVTAIRRRRMV